ncbi:MAG: phosphoenolpyruvate carboxykinase (ATP) [Acholeplasmatales bacterium]|nr:MAG: phosphoenolpyruvate carboxykinase (ATP) [Acholeplasmatales bacterium]
MATKSHLPKTDIGGMNPKLFNRIRTTLETAYFQNNVIRVETLEEAYHLAKHSPGTVITDLPVEQPEALGLPSDAKVLLFNDGAITGRQAQARRIVSNETVDYYAKILREGLFENRYRTLYHATAVIGLHEKFSVKAHLLIPEGYENTLYSWMLNFQVLDTETMAMYANSNLFDEGDILLYSDPDTFIDGHPEGLCVFDRDHNCAALFGMRYFGEHKKGSLTMAWSIAERQGFTPCHGGLKRFETDDAQPFVMGVFGLSGSGKSTITHAKHPNLGHVTVLHDDAFVIDNTDGATVSLEPTYFDKVQDYPTDSPDHRYLLTLQNVGVTRDDTGAVVPVTEDIRNGNGRAVKSKFWTADRAYCFTEPIKAIFWIMKDDALPPLMKVHDPALAATLGATLATKRTSAEHGADTTKLAMVPYANPFRLYPLASDYDHFKHLFEQHAVECYILNTGHFGKKKIPPHVTLSLVEAVVNKSIDLKPFELFADLSYALSPDLVPDFNDATYVEAFTARMRQRLEYLQQLDGEERLPKEAIDSVMSRLNLDNRK